MEFEHAQRMPETRYQNKNIDWNPGDKRKRGGSKISWQNSNNQEMSHRDTVIGYQKTNNVICTDLHIFYLI